MIQIHVQGQDPMYPSISEVGTSKECQRTFVQFVKMHNQVRHVPREKRSRMNVKVVVLIQQNIVLTLIWYALQRAIRLM